MQQCPVYEPDTEMVVYGHEGFVPDGSGYSKCLMQALIVEV